MWLASRSRNFTWREFSPGCLATNRVEPLADGGCVEADDSADGPVQVPGGGRVVVGQVGEVQRRVLSQHEGHERLQVGLGDRFAGVDLLEGVVGGEQVREDG
jgi:hypothetical protein